MTPNETNAPLQNVPDPRKFPVTYWMTFWNTGVGVLLAVGQTEVAAITGALGALVPFTVVGIRALRGKSTSVV
ncbi:hypothetical protein [Sinimarinibacterium flocculans]|uniref:hypothetical protein n=1 Tax=Sinimarinibacterium flocculans TaxID=985250 RepID=UPI002492013B|nr:hypothetical protein [Sinimarinibacterium flocculans]